MGRILVTGASGNVGKYVTHYAIANKQEVTVAGTSVEKLSTLFGDTARIVRFDFADPATFSQALEDVDRIFIMRPPHLGKLEDLKPFIDAVDPKKNKTR